MFYHFKEYIQNLYCFNVDIFWKRKYKINKENEIMVKSESGHLISKLVYDTTAENVFIQQLKERL